MWSFSFFVIYWILLTFPIYIYIYISVRVWYRMYAMQNSIFVSKS